MDYAKTLKVKLKHIAKIGIKYNKLIKCIKNANYLTFICSSFIRAYLLYLFENDIEIPKLDVSFIRMAFKALSKPSNGPKPKGANLILFNDLCSFYDKCFSECMPKNKDNTNCEKFDACNLSYIIGRIGTEMETSYVNNVQLNFRKYVNQYVNETFLSDKFKKKSRDEINKLTKSEKNVYYKNINLQRSTNNELKRELYFVKNDIMDCTNTSDIKYKVWIETFITESFPLKSEKITYDDDLKKNPYGYIKTMMIMNKFLESKGKKMFQCIPLRTSITDSYVPIDTSALKDIYGQIGKNKELERYDENELIWNKYFNIDKKKLKIKRYTFNHLIYTDGTYVSINFIENEQIVKKDAMLEK